MREFHSRFCMLAGGVSISASADAAILSDKPFVSGMLGTLAEDRADGAPHVAIDLVALDGPAALAAANSIAAQ